LKGAGRDTAEILLEDGLTIYYKNCLKMASVQGWTLNSYSESEYSYVVSDSYCESGYTAFGSNIYGKSGYPGLRCIVMVKVGIQVWRTSRLAPFLRGSTSRYPFSKGLCEPPEF